MVCQIDSDTWFPMVVSPVSSRMLHSMQSSDFASVTVFHPIRTRALIAASGYPPSAGFLMAVTIVVGQHVPRCHLQASLWRHRRRPLSIEVHNRPPFF
jgi:hypothetical protein